MLLRLIPKIFFYQDGSIPRSLLGGWMPPAVIGAKPLSVIPRSLLRGGFIRMDEGLNLFIDVLGFTILHQDETLAVVGQDGAKAYIVESQEYAAKDRPEIAIETDDINSIFESIAARHPGTLHPN